MMWTSENELTEEEERRLALIPDCPRRKKPPRPILAAYRKLSLEAQRDRVAREVRALTDAERQHPTDYRRQRQANFYYRSLYEALAEAEHCAKGGM
jgi:hypothetical protein